MSRPDSARLDDIANAIRSIYAHLEHGPISVEIVLDAVAMRLLEIGEAVKGLSPYLTATEPDVDWSGAAGMRDSWPTTTSPPGPTSFSSPSTSGCPNWRRP